MLLKKIGRRQQKSFYPFNAYFLFQEEALKIDCVRKQQKIRVISVLKIFSIWGSATGGVLLASNVAISPYGFIFLAASSFSITIASILEKNFLNIFYGTTLFIGVDLLGVYRWIIIA